MKRIIRLTESDLTRIVRRVLNEQPSMDDLGSLPLKIKVGDTVQVGDDTGHLKIKIEKITPKGYEGVITKYSGNFGLSSGQTPQVNIGVYDSVIIKTEGNKISVILNRYKNPIIIQRKNIRVV